MGDGPNTKQTIEVSKEASILDRIKNGEDTGGSGDGSSTGVCLRERRVLIDGSADRIAVGDPVQVPATLPAQAHGLSGVIGPVVGPHLEQLESCLRAGFAYFGEVVEIGSSGIRALVRGAES
jgi:hypothetical protein